MQEIGRIFVNARVKVPLMYNMKDKTGGDTRRIVKSDFERQTCKSTSSPPVACDV